MNIDRPYLENTRWTHPRHYMGYSPDGEFLVYSRHRDSDLEITTNFDGVIADLTKASKDTPEAVYSWRASHCLVGWVDYLMIKEDAPAHVLDLAEEILERLDGYPIYCENALSEAEMEAEYQAWTGWAKAELISAISDEDTEAHAETMSDDDLYEIYRAAMDSENVYTQIEGGGVNIPTEWIQEAFQRGVEDHASRKPQTPKT